MTEAGVRGRPVLFTLENTQSCVFLWLIFCHFGTNLQSRNRWCLLSPGPPSLSRDCVMSKPEWKNLRRFIFELGGLEILVDRLEGDRSIGICSINNRQHMKFPLANHPIPLDVYIVIAGMNSTRAPGGGGKYIRIKWRYRQVFTSITLHPFNLIFFW